MEGCQQAPKDADGRLKQVDCCVLQCRDNDLAQQVAWWDAASSGCTGQGNLVLPLLHVRCSIGCRWQLLGPAALPMLS